MTLRRLPAALLLVALIGAGCGDAASDTSTAPAAADGAGTASTASTAEKPEPSTKSQAVRFAECMRDNGVREFPDPDASGRLTVDAVVNGSSVDPEGPVWQQAISACKDLQPAGFTGGERTTGQQQAALEFARCIRENGVEDFPDPEPGEPLVNTNRIPSSGREGGMETLNAAMKTCGDIVADFVGAP